LSLVIESANDHYLSRPNVNQLLMMLTAFFLKG
jgi:hypothetical protein